MGTLSAGYYIYNPILCEESISFTKIFRRISMFLASHTFQTEFLQPEVKMGRLAILPLGLINITRKGQAKLQALLCLANFGVAVLRSSTATIELSFFVGCPFNN